MSLGQTDMFTGGPLATLKPAPPSVSPAAGEELDLRAYQLDSIEELRTGLRMGHQWQILNLPTGAGKTHIAAYLMQEALAKRSRALFVCDLITLVDQTSRLFASMGIPHGVQQGNNSHGLHHRLKVASAQTLEARGFWRDLDLLIIDECHVQRQKLLAAAHKWGGPVIGLTATALTSGLGNHYSRIVNVTTTDQLVAEGFLAPVHVYAGVEIDMEGAPTNSRGEWSDDIAAQRGSRIVGDIVSTWVEQVHKHFGGPVKTIAFSATIAHGEEMCAAFQAAGYDFRQISYLDRNDDRRRKLIDAFRQGDIMGLVSCEALCLSDDTEVLTRAGWRGIDTIALSDEVAQVTTEGAASFIKPTVITRDERSGSMVRTADGRLLLTPGHRLLARSPGARAWREESAGDASGKRRHIPVSAHMPPLRIHVSEPSGPAATRAHRIRSNSYHYRQQGIPADEARQMAAKRIDARDAMRYTQPSVLTEDDCQFIGFWLGDGSVSNGNRGGLNFTLSQSKRYQPIVDWIDALLARLGVHATRHLQPQSGNMTTDAIRWRLARGTGFGPQARSGIYRLEPYLDKHATAIWHGLNTKQYEALLHGLWMADGDHTESGTAPAYRITGANYGLFSSLQAVGALRGWDVSLRLAKPATSRHRSRWTLYARKVQHRSFRLHEQPGYDGRVWCVTVPTGWILTRRNGRVAVVGNSKGFDVPDTLCLIGARPYRKSLAAHLQQIGRVMRAAPNKTFGLVLDHCVEASQRVLTRRGMVAIFNIRNDDLLWDGVEWVAHGGAVRVGRRKVMEYAGLRATGDHKVWTRRGWLTLREAARTLEPIAQTGAAGQALRLSANRFRSDRVPRVSWEPAPARPHRMRHVRLSIHRGAESFADRAKRWLSGLQSATAHLSPVVVGSMRSHEAALHESQRPRLAELRCERYRVSMGAPQGCLSLDHGALGYTGEPLNSRLGSDRQRWSLCAWQPKVGVASPERRESTTVAIASDACIQIRASGHQIRRRHLVEVHRRGAHKRGNRCSLAHPIVQTEGEVWDIRDAGPRNRFTCEGLLTHNSGNFHGFLEETLHVWAHGVSDLDHGNRPVTRREKKERVDVKCTCGFVVPPGAMACLMCGRARHRRADVEVVPGYMQEVDLTAAGSRRWRENREWTWHQMLGVANTWKRDPQAAQRLALAQYRAFYGDWPPLQWGHTPTENLPDRRVERMMQKLAKEYREQQSQQGSE